MKQLVSVSRQFGSGGREIAAMLANKLEVPYYDNELISMAAKQSGIAEDVAKSVDEKATSSLFYTSPAGYVWSTHHVSVYQDVSFHDKLYLAQSDIIKKIAATGKGVVVGRCGDYVMREFGSFNVFIHADMRFRKARAVEKYGIAEKNAESVISKTDKKRYAYYNYYTGGKWGKAENYHLCIDSGIGLEAVVDTILAALNRL